MIAYHRNNRSVFIYGFAKNERDNIEARELINLKKLVKRFIALAHRGGWRLLVSGTLAGRLV